MKHPDRTVKRVGRDYDVVYREWPSRGAMLTMLHMQDSRAPRSDDWSAVVPVSEATGWHRSRPTATSVSVLTNGHTRPVGVIFAPTDTVERDLRHHYSLSRQGHEIIITGRRSQWTGGGHGSHKDKPVTPTEVRDKNWREQYDWEIAPGGLQSGLFTEHKPAPTVKGKPAQGSQMGLFRTAPSGARTNDRALRRRGLR